MLRWPIRTLRPVAKLFHVTSMEKSSYHRILLNDTVLQQLIELFDVVAVLPDFRAQPTEETCQTGCLLAQFFTLPSDVSLGSHKALPSHYFQSSLHIFLVLPLGFPAFLVGSHDGSPMLFFILVNTVPQFFDR